MFRFEVSKDALKFVRWTIDDDQQGCVSSMVHRPYLRTGNDERGDEGENLRHRLGRIKSCWEGYVTVEKA